MNTNFFNIGSKARQHASASREREEICPPSAHILGAPNSTQPCAIVGVFDYGREVGQTRHSIIVGLEFSDGQSVYILDFQPFKTGGPVHCLTCQVTRFSLATHQINLSELVGGRVLASVAPDGDFVRLVRVEPASNPIRYSMPSLPKCAPNSVLQFGWVEDGSGNDSKPASPPVPTLRSKPILWKVSELSTPTLPDDLPPIVKTLAEKSSEFLALKKSEAGSPAWIRNLRCLLDTRANP
jgi:hypothetical protein